MPKAGYSRCPALQALGYLSWPAEKAVGFVERLYRDGYVCEDDYFLRIVCRCGLSAAGTVRLISQRQLRQIPGLLVHPAVDGVVVDGLFHAARSVTVTSS